MKDKIKNIKNQLKKNKNKMGKKKYLFEEEKRTKPNSKDVCVVIDVFVNVSMERLKTEQIELNIRCKTFTREKEKENFIKTVDDKMN